MELVQATADNERRIKWVGLRSSSFVSKIEQLSLLLHEISLGERILLFKS